MFEQIRIWKKSLFRMAFVLPNSIQQISRSLVAECSPPPAMVKVSLSGQREEGREDLGNPSLKVCSVANLPPALGNVA